MSLNSVTIFNNKLAKRHIEFQQNSTIQAKFYKYLGGDNLVYKNYTLEDQNGENYSQLYNVSGTTTTDSNFNVNANYLQYGYTFLPKFAVIMFAGLAANIPAGWLLCDGRTVVINGVTVTSPDLSGRFVLSIGQGPLNFANSTLGATGGEQNHTLTVAELPPHSHTHNANGATGSPPTGYGLIYSNTLSTNNGSNLDSNNFEPNLNYPIGALTINNTGSGNAHNTMPPYYVLCYIMKGF